MTDDEPRLMRQYSAWLAPIPRTDDPGRGEFFADALVVLDTNTLLNLYQYTPPARGQVLGALQRVSERLWMPYQVGLEFVRGRHRVLHDRAKGLNDAKKDVTRRLEEARESVLDATGQVEKLLIRYADDRDASAALRGEINSQAVDQAFAAWRTKLLEHVQDLQSAHDLALGTVNTGDPVLPQVAALYGDNVAGPIPPEVLRQRVEDAAKYRYPNEIPPGFMDDAKDTPLRAAGDYLLWAEIVERAASLSEPRRVLLVSDDTKDDWYEPAEPGRGRRPWPMLFDELRLCAGAELRIETSRDFFLGVGEFLQAEIGEATFEEIERAAEPPETTVVTEDTAPRHDPPSGLALLAYQAAGLATTAVREMLASPTHRVFQWWLIGVTAQLSRRTAGKDEPWVTISAANRSKLPPAPYWLPGTELRSGEWPYRSSSWIAPWFAQVLKATTESDRAILQRLAAQQVDLEAPEPDGR